MSIKKQLRVSIDIELLEWLEAEADNLGIRFNEYIEKILDVHSTQVIEAGEKLAKKILGGTKA